MAELKVAIVGLGKMGLLHASILNVIPDVEVVALCDTSSVLIRLAKKLFKKSKLVNDVNKLADLDINTIYVTTPIPSHYPILKTIFSMRLIQNIFVEKTLASNWIESNELCKLSTKFGSVNMVGYMKRFGVTFNKAKQILLEDVIGNLISFTAHAYSSDFSKVKQASNKSMSRGGVLSDLGSHVIDLAMWFFGNLEVNSARIDSMNYSGSEDIAHFEVKNSKLKGQIHTSWCMDNYRMPAFGLQIKGTHGSLNVTDYSVELDLKNKARSTWFKQDLNDTVNFLLGDSEYYRENKFFVDSILKGTNSEPSFTTASKVDYLIDQVRQKGEND